MNGQQNTKPKKDNVLRKVLLLLSLRYITLRYYFYILFQQFHTLDIKQQHRNEIQIQKGVRDRERERERAKKFANVLR